MSTELYSYLVIHEIHNCNVNLVIYRSSVEVLFGKNTEIPGAWSGLKWSMAGAEGMVGAMHGWGKVGQFRHPRGKVGPSDRILQIG